MRNIPTKIITHHAVSLKTHTAEDVDDWHKDRWPGFTSKVFKNKRGQYYHVGYHYVIEWDGTIVQCRGEGEEGAHCVGLNTSSIGVCFIGNFDNHLPSKEQEIAFINLYSKLYEKYPIAPTEILPHRRYANKSCHGALLIDAYFGNLVSDVPLKKKILDLQQIVIQLTALLTKKRMSLREK